MLENCTEVFIAKRKDGRLVSFEFDVEARCLGADLIEEGTEVLSAENRMLYRCESGGNANTQCDIRQEMALLPMGQSDTRRYNVPRDLLRSLEFYTEQPNRYNSSYADCSLLNS